MRQEQELKGDGDHQIINNLIIRPEELKDYSSIVLINNLAFAQDNEAKLIDQIRHNLM
ncbi:MAG: hypothetical protein ACFCU7_18425 [Pleurocapsa sp.]